jgi:hypothetical protein
METLAIIFFALAALVLVLAIVFVLLFYKPIEYDEYFTDDAPARYEDYEECFYNP